MESEGRGLRVYFETFHKDDWHLSWMIRWASGLETCQEVGIETFVWARLLEYTDLEEMALKVIGKRVGVLVEWEHLRRRTGVRRGPCPARRTA